MTTDWLPFALLAVATLAFLGLGLWLGVRASWRDGRAVWRWFVRRRRGERAPWPLKDGAHTVFFQTAALLLVASALASWAQALIPSAR